MYGVNTLEWTGSLLARGRFLLPTGDMGGRRSIDDGFKIHCRERPGSD